MLAAACVLAIGAAAAPSALAATALHWSGRVAVDTPDGAHALRAVSCATAHFCAVVDDTGNAATSTNPLGGAAAWNLRSIDGTEVLRGISCTVSLCVAVDSSGNVITRTNPTNPASAWAMPVAVDAPNALLGVSCPSASLCVAVDAAGQVVTSTQPAGGASKWTAVAVDPSPNVLEAVSCPSATFCAAVDNHGNAVTSTNPTGGATAWKLHAHVDSSTSPSLGAVSCRSSALCVAVDDSGNMVSSTNPHVAAAWKTAHVEGATFNTLFGVSCPTPSFCAAVDDNGNALTASIPTGGPAAWGQANVDARWGFYGVSCGSLTLCVAVDAGGNVVVGQLRPPGTTITKKTVRRKRHSVTFAFKAIGTASSFQCKIKRKGSKGKPTFKRCRSPRTYKNLAAGDYVFFVRALNAAGADPTPAKAPFKI